MPKLAKGKLMHSNIIELKSSAKLTTKYGAFSIHVYHEMANPHKEHAALISACTNFNNAVTVRVHSSCLTGDVFFSCQCDCRQQLDYALQKIGCEGGVLVYLDQEGRNIGLANKIKAYSLQDQGLDTVEANIELGFGIDERCFDIGADILKLLQITDVNLLTNNLDKIQALQKCGINVHRLTMPISNHPLTQHYLQTKKIKMRHLL